MAELNIRVNERMWKITAAPDTPLLYVLSNELGLQGPRFGCGLAQCGSCSVLVEGVLSNLGERISGRQLVPFSDAPCGCRSDAASVRCVNRRCQPVRPRIGRRC